MPELTGDLPYVVVHGGVHKTATSFIQGRLQRNAGRMRKQGLHYLNHRQVRKEYTFPSQLHGYEKIGLDYKTKITAEELDKLARDFFGSIGAEPGQRIILSDENMPGHSGHCVRSGKLYQRRATLIPIFAQFIPYPVTEVHLAIRNYADFFASTYVEFLRSATGDKVFPEAQMKRQVLSKVPSWVRFIAIVQKAFAGAELILWRHEDFGKLSNRIIGNLCGPDFDVATMAEPKRQRGRPSASHRAVQELLMEIERSGGTAALARRVEIQEKYPRGPDYPGYDPWEPAERAHLTRLYDSDIETIKNTMKVTFLDPDSNR
ncbi:hypothetical protein [Roseovarius nubinhibens]|uniref:Sulfotransferase domain-containing protein n=1 Tax=Roseovarius nubinhibens TaxID=314263 RepID=A0A348WG20_9RHOB|nr:hypothetical protein [Roseovarius nubinhibens]|tara:strand:- start:2405 stop:3358 length:954 start_codon:yes stop_codon:yes gene_type:complete